MKARVLAHTPASSGAAPCPAGTRRILLVDDVVVSGPPIEAAVGALPASLARNAAVLAIFRAV